MCEANASIDDEGDSAANLPTGLAEEPLEGPSALEVAHRMAGKLHLGEQPVEPERMQWKRRAKKRH